jgi:hypothetical protein
MSAEDIGIEVWGDSTSVLEMVRKLDEGATKSELTFPADTRKALHRDGRWFIIPEKYCYWYFGTVGFDSLVFHVCSKHWIDKTEAAGWGELNFDRNPYTTGRMTEKGMTKPCEYCGDLPSKGLVALWKLHNFDYLSLNDHDA